MLQLVGRRILRRIFPTSRPHHVRGISLPREQLQKTGQSLMWVGNIYPIKRSKYDVRWMFYDDDLKKALPPLFPDIIKIDEIYPRLKEGGAIVHFEAKDPNVLAYMSLPQVTKEYLMPHLQEQFSSSLREEPRMNTVLGEPYFEEISSILPTPKLKISFTDAGETVDGNKVFSPSLLEHPAYQNFGVNSQNYNRFDLRQQEPLYAVLANYGGISDLKMFTSPPPKDDLPHAIVDFENLECAISARTCLHRAPFPMNVSLQIDYLPYTPTHSKLYQMIVSNTRLSVFFGAILLTLMTLLLFDPLRAASIFSKLMWGKPTDSDWTSTDLLSSKGKEVPVYSEMSKVLENTFSMKPDSVMVITGPTGVGKSKLVTHSAQKNGALLIKIGRDIHTGEMLIERFVKGAGYFPSYSIAYQLGTLVDSLIPGSKTSSLNPTIDTQLSNILMCIRKSLKYSKFIRDSKGNTDVPVIAIDGIQRVLDELDPKMAQLLTYSICDFTRRVIRKHRAHVVFVNDNLVESQKLRELFVQSNLPVEHMIIEEPSYQEITSYLEKELVPLIQERPKRSHYYDMVWNWIPNRTRRTREGQEREGEEREGREGEEREREGECEREGEEREGEEGERVCEEGEDFVKNLEKNLTPQEVVDLVTKNCGCRPRDINSVIRMVKDGRSLTGSIEALKSRAENDWRTRILPPFTKSCTFFQLMLLVQELCEKDFVSYDHLLYNVFDGDPSKLHLLITSDVLRSTTFRCENTEKMEVYVTPSSQLRLVSLRTLVQDKALREKLVRSTVRQETKLIHEKAQKLEEELKTIAEILYRSTKSNSISEKTKILEERQKKLLTLLEGLMKRQKRVDDLNKWDPTILSEEDKKKSSSASSSGRRFYFF